MKWLKIIALGIIGWSLSLIWPDVNNLLTVEVMTGLVLGLGGLVLIYVTQKYWEHLKQHHNSNGTGQNNHHHFPPDQTGPMPILHHLT